MKQIAGYKFDNEWLGIKQPEHALFNPLDYVFNGPDMDLMLDRLLCVCSNPEYFRFVTRYILNLDMLPFQLVILQELWERKYPMLVASRGASKAISPDELVRVQNGWSKIKDLQVGSKVYGSDGKLCSVTSKTELMENLNFYKITLADGREIECCEDHMWKVWDKNKNRHTPHSNCVYSELTTKDMVNNYYRNRIGEKSSGLEYRYALPISQPLENETSSDLPIHPYVLGVILGDGCMRSPRVTISSSDQEIVDKVNSLLPSGYALRKIPSSKYGYSIIKLNKEIPAFRCLTELLGIHGLGSKDKFIPDVYKYANLDDRMELLKGLMDTDGCSNKKNMSYTTISPFLSQDVSDLLRSCGINCRVTRRKSFYNKVQHNDHYHISIYTDKPIFHLTRKLKNYRIKSMQGQSKYHKVFITKIEYIGRKNGMCISVDNYDKTYITKDYIVTHNSFCMSVYAILRALLIPKRRVVIVGAAFRQSKVLFNYMEDIWNNAPILRDICDKNSGCFRETDKCTLRINNSVITCLPLGTGDKIRGQRAHDIIADEMASIPIEIFETVVAGFANVAANPVEKVKRARIKKLGIIQKEQFNDDSFKENQIIMAGTAYYDFNHFAKYWKQYRSFLRTNGNYDKLREVLNDNDPTGFNWKDYSVIRVPVKELPDGLMDEGMIARAKATVHAGIYEMEYGAVFSSDSQGFFKRSLIESCVVSHANEATFPDGVSSFEPALLGCVTKKYVMGIDPASEVDNFSIVILETHENHRRIVYSWTTNRKQHRERVNAQITQETDFYSYCARKIRELMAIFPCKEIALDSQGGGIAVSEALHDKNRLGPVEHPIWPVIDPEKEKDTDDYAGFHILKLCHFSKSEWTSEANHGMRKDLEDKVLLFPHYDPVSLELSYQDDKMSNRLYDTLEDCVFNIEELKDELATIIITQTATGRERWDTPEYIIGTGKKGRLRKDRYSALLMANMSARTKAPTNFLNSYRQHGGFAKTIDIKKMGDGPDYNGPAWWMEGQSSQDDYYM